MFLLLLSLAFGCLSTFGLYNISVLNIDFFQGSNFITVLIVFSFSFVIFSAFKLLKKNYLFFVLPLAFFYSFFLVLGKFVSQDQFILFNLKNFFQLILHSAFIIPIISAFVILIFAFFDSQKQDCIQVEKDKFLYKFFSKTGFVFLFLLICWLPAYLACFPGVWNYDTVPQLAQFYLGRFTTHHSFIYSALLYFFVQFGKSFGNLILGIILYTTCQMFFIAFCFAYSCNFLCNIGVKTKYIAFVLLFYVLSPYNFIYALSSVHDSIFSALFLLFLIFVAKLFLYPNANGLIFKMIITASLAVLLRSQFLIVLLLFLPFLFFIQNKKIVKCISVVTLSTALIFSLSSFAYNKIFKPLPYTLTEAISLPLHNVATVIYNHPDKIDQNDKNLFFKVVPEKNMKYYSKFSVDPIKQDSSNAFICVFNEKYLKSHFSDYIHLYLKFCKKYIQDYINSFITMTLFYWYPDKELPWEYYNVGFVCPFIDGTHYLSMCSYDNEQNNKLFRILDEKKFQLQDGRQFYFLPDFQYFLGSLGDFRLKCLPFLSFFFSLSFSSWFVLLLIFYNLYKQNMVCTMLLLYCLIYILTFLFGPMALLRYILPVYMSLPLLFCLTFTKNKS